VEPFLHRPSLAIRPSVPPPARGPPEPANPRTIKETFVPATDFRYPYMAGE